VKRRGLLATLCVIAATATACGGTGDKAGGDLGGGPVTLTVAAYDESQLAELEAAVERLTNGSVKWRVRPPRGATRADYEASAVAAVRRGSLDLAIIDAHTLDRAGVTGFRAVLAPFLVDSLALEERVLEGSVGRRMLDAVERAGLVGVGVLPGPLGRPVGVTQSLTLRGEFRGSVVGTIPSPTATRTFRALGARARGADLLRDLGAVDGADLTVTELDATGLDNAARSIAADVVLWPHVLVAVANPQRFRSLGDARNVLRRATHDAIAPAVERIRTQELAGLARICERNVAGLETTRPRQRALLRRAVGAVYDELGLDQLTFELLWEIEQLREESRPDVLRCATPAPAGQTASGRLDGVWEWSVSEAELRAVAETPAGIANSAGRWRLVVGDGRFELRGIDAGDVYRGTFRMTDERIVARVDGTRTTDPSWQYSWSLYRDELTLSPVEGAPAAAQLVAKPLTRAD
jgi:TRAP-type C4-dicarboxylate transport system substrate-binding protein